MDLISINDMGHLFDSDKIGFKQFWS